MNKQEFLRQLEYLLRDIPQNERREAMEYYRSYFEDAGPENEAKIIDELGSPQEAAASIRKDLFGEEDGEIHLAEKKEQPQDKTARNLLIAFIAILSFPLWAGIAAAAFGLLVSGIALVFVFAIVIAALVGAFVFAGFVLAGIGVGQVFTGAFAAGLVLFAMGMFLLAAAVLGGICIAWGAGWLLPGAVRAMVGFCKKLLRKRGAAV